MLVFPRTSYIARAKLHALHCSDLYILFNNQGTFFVPLPMSPLKSGSSSSQDTQTINPKVLAFSTALHSKGSGQYYSSVLFGCTEVQLACLPIVLLIEPD